MAIKNTLKCEPPESFLQVAVELCAENHLMGLLCRTLKDKGQDINKYVFLPIK